MNSKPCDYEPCPNLVTKFKSNQRTMLKGYCDDCVRRKVWISPFGRKRRLAEIEGTNDDL